MTQWHHKMSVKRLCHHWFKQWLVVCSALSYYLNQCWLIENWLQDKTINRLRSQHFASRKYYYNDVIMGAIASQITSLVVVNSIVYSDADQRKHQSSASLAFVRGPVNSPHKWPVTRKLFPFVDDIMTIENFCQLWSILFRLTQCVKTSTDRQLEIYRISSVVLPIAYSSI